VGADQSETIKQSIILLSLPTVDPLFPVLKKEEIAQEG
jgi:hypothetical protein